MSEITKAGTDMSRGIRPSEAVKAWEAIEKDRAVIIAAEGAKKRTWSNWRTIGLFILEKTNKAKAETGGTTRGPTYAKAVAKAMGDFHPIFQKQGRNGTVFFLMNIIADLQAVEAWLDTLPKDARPHHPKRVWEAYEDSKKGPVISFKDEAPEDLFADNDEADVDDEDGSSDGASKKKRRRPEGKSTLREDILEMLAVNNDNLVTRLQGDETPNDFANAFRRSLSERGIPRAAIIDRMMKFGRALIAVAEALRREDAAADTVLDDAPAAPTKKTRKKAVKEAA